jgi:hypothetical protein
MANGSRGKQPTSKRAAPASAAKKPVDETVRLNVLIPSQLHKRVKMGCVSEGISMTDVVTEFLETRFPKA